ncbi:hypothetical protein [Haladaptatus sp. DYF46]|uniref:hypothetical protein n=1 Tax=Haladaptatus sp. DYF46 TaxID=2886041 RepID=UPI001E5C03B4|nr:hypothetical protein [Haladaptatus sp. DYF46]
MSLHEPFGASATAVVLADEEFGETGGKTRKRPGDPLRPWETARNRPRTGTDHDVSGEYR